MVFTLDPTTGEKAMLQKLRGMAYAFVSLKVAGLFAGHNPENLGSRNLLTKLGFNYTHDEFYKPTGLEHPSYLLKAKEYAHNWWPSLTA